MQRHLHNGVPSFGVMRPVPSDLSPQTASTVQTVPDFVLYVHPSCGRCLQLVDLLKINQLRNVLVQDVRALQTKPQWLDGVPILADAKIGLIYKGSDAIAFVANLVESSIQPPAKQAEPDFAPVRDTHGPRDTQQLQAQRRFPDVTQDSKDHLTTADAKKSSLDDLFNESGITGTSSNACAISLPDNSHRYVESGNSKLSATTISDYQSQRQAQVSKK